MGLCADWGHVVEVVSAALTPLLSKRKKTGEDLACMAKWQSSLEGLRVAHAEFQEARASEEARCARREREKHTAQARRSKCVRYSPS